MNKPRTLARILLQPLSVLYGTATAVRNRMFDAGILKQHTFDIPVVVVGNLTAGGTGKTPHTEMLVELLRDRYRIGVLSRGYRRSTKGFVAATPYTTPADIGDESYQLYHKFRRRITVAVCENRVKGIAKMLEIDPGINLIIMDDGMQHRYVKPKVTVMLTDINRPYYDDHMLPYGLLRESAAGKRRADMVMVTKCQRSMKPIEYNLVTKNLDLIPDQDLFFTTFGYDTPRPVFADKAGKRTVNLADLTTSHGILAVCGIGNPRPFVKYLKGFHARVKVNVYSDHHAYSRHDMENLKERFESLPPGHRYIFTTEKDAVKLLNSPYFPHSLKPYIYYIPVHVELLNDTATRLKDALVKRINARPL